MTLVTLKLYLVVPHKKTTRAPKVAPEKKRLLKPARVPVKAPVRIMVFGTFDMIHPGHKHFFAQARALVGSSKSAPRSFLIVSLARDKNVLRIKGKAATSKERKRLARVKALKEVDKAVLGAIGDHIPHIVKERPDVIALGYDQAAYVGGLRSALAKAGLKVKIVRMKPHLPNKYKTSLLTRSKKR